MTRPATLPSTTDFFLALTNEAPERRDGFRVWFVNNTDTAVTVKLRSSAILDLNSGPMRLGKDELPAWELLGDVPPRSARTVNDGLCPASDVIVYHDVEIAMSTGIEERQFTVFLDEPRDSEPEALPVLGRRGYPFLPESRRA